ncbi:MAG: hypothetical protein K0Q77_1898, partial [Anaerosporomusa subterranea]|nr:hypothetical protein [Anaerosporomusa subterranea]
QHDQYSGSDPCELVQALLLVYGCHSRVRLRVQHCLCRNGHYMSRISARVSRTNTQLVERVVRIAKEIGREIANSAEACEMPGISP